MITAMMCLALNVYFEAGNQSIEGKEYVAAVTINRVDSRRFPDTVCAVVKQKTGSTCMFSWYCDGKSDVPHEDTAWRDSLAIAELALANRDTLPDTRATHYHATYVHPYWADKITFLTQVGDHLFYIEE